jgi:stringent starvation protein A
MPIGKILSKVYSTLKLQKGSIKMMKLYSGSVDPFSHRCRIVLFEKGMDFEVIDVDLANKAEDLAVLNPYGAVPVLVERDLVLSEANIINEYIDERFPHPQLMPADPVMRARARLFLYNFEKDLFDHIKDVESDDQEIADKGRKTIRDNLTQIVPIFSKQNYLLGDDYSMLDVAVTPLLWRLGHYGIDLPNQAAPLLKYAERLFSRPLYADAMTPSEKAMRK